jgi:hypothetical protein
MRTACPHQARRFATPTPPSSKIEGEEKFQTTEKEVEEDKRKRQAVSAAGLSAMLEYI